MSTSADAAIDVPGETGEDAGAFAADDPLPPEPPRMEDWSCPSGWVAETVGTGEVWAHRICQPPEQEVCTGATAQFLGDGGCGRVGTACPVAGERFLSEEALRTLAEGFDGPILYVDGRAPADGDGSRARPFRTGHEALAHAVAGMVITLAPGTYQETLQLLAPLALVGTCADGTTLLAPDRTEDQATLVIGPAGGALAANLTVTGPRVGLYLAPADTPSTVRATVFESTLRAGIAADGPAVHLDDIVVRHTQVGSAESYGLVAEAGARVQMTRALFEANEAQSLVVQSGASLTVSDVVVRDTLADPADGVGIGLLVAPSAAAVDLQRGLFERNPSGSITIGGDAESPAPTVALEDLVVRDGGTGLYALGNVRVTLTRGLFERNRSSGLTVFALPDIPAASAQVQDLVVRDTLQAADNTDAGSGIWVEAGAELNASRAWVLGTHGVGILVADGATVAASDVVVGDTEAAPGFTDSAGRAAQGGYGIFVETGAALDASRAWVERTQGSGIVALDHATVSASDLVVVNSEGTPGEIYAAGLWLESGAQVQLTRGQFLHNRALGVVAMGWAEQPPTHLTLSDVAIRDTRLAPCGEIPEGEDGSCIVDGINWGDGMGLIVTGAEALLDGFDIRGSARVGLVIDSETDSGDHNPTVTAHHGEIVGNAIGIDVLVPDYDFQTLYDDVFVHDNGVDVARNEIPVPTVVLPSLSSP